MKKPLAVDPKSKVKRPLVKAVADKDTAIDGEASPRRADRAGYKRGGAVKKGSTVNIVIAPQGGAPGVGTTPAAQMAVRPPMTPPAMVPGAGAPPPMVRPPMAPPPGAIPAGGPPPGLMVHPPMPPQGLGAGPAPFKRGGVVKAGAGTGLGRLMKADRS